MTKGVYSIRIFSFFTNSICKNETEKSTHLKGTIRRIRDGLFSDLMLVRAWFPYRFHCRRYPGNGGSERYICCIGCRLVASVTAPYRSLERVFKTLCSNGHRLWFVFFKTVCCECQISQARWHSQLFMFVFFCPSYHK